MAYQSPQCTCCDKAAVEHFAAEVQPCVILLMLFKRANSSWAKHYLGTLSFFLQGSSSVSGASLGIPAPIFFMIAYLEHRFLKDSFPMPNAC